MHNRECGHSQRDIFKRRRLNRRENDEVDPQSLKNKLILMPSAELSRARGGFHCMSMPLHRDFI
ncbi:MAG TPA: arginine deiminase family protein [Mucilaginibacter sp.]